MLTVREAVGSNVEVTAAVGSAEQAWPVRIRATADNRAEFTIRGGLGYTPISIVGLTRYRDFTLKKKSDDGSWDVINQSSPVGRDWWQTRYNPTSATWELIFTIPLDTPEDTRRVTHTFLRSTEL